MAGQVLKDLAAEQRIRELEAENAALKKAKERRPTDIRLANKGGVSVYLNAQRYPVTLYDDGWDELLEIADDIRKFIDTNRSKLSRKK